MTKVTEKRAERKADTRQRIAGAAWELFTTVGYDETTTKSVAKRAGVATGTVFVHARDKADLLALVMHDRLAAAVDAAFDSLPRGSLVERLLHVFRTIFRMYGEHPKVAAAFVRTLPGADGPNGQRVSALTFAFLHRLAGLVQEAQAKGEVGADIQPLLAASNVFGLYYQALLGWLIGYASLETALDPGLRSALELQMRGLWP